MQPILLNVDDDPQVQRTLELDLRSHYSRFRVLVAKDGGSALQLLKQLKIRNETCALFLIDQRMPDMTGVEFLEHAMEIFPETKRVLLTAYADSDAAINSINKAKIDYYIMKPWDPPEDNLYPILDDLLDDWLASNRPVFDGIRILGLRWSPDSFAVRNFLAQNAIPYQWLDVESTEEGKKLLEYLNAKEDSNIKPPTVLFPDGSYLESPTNSQLAEKIGLRTQTKTRYYDLAIIGGGPSGLAAAVYGASEGLHTVLIESRAPGGQAGTSSNIENYLGFPAGLTGANLARRAVTQARKFGAEIINPQEVTGIRVDGPYRHVRFADGTEIRCHVLLISTGVAYRKLENVSGFDKLVGAGIYYGSSLADAALCKDQEVFFVGGANSAGQAAIHFAGYAKKVVMLIRRDSLSNSMSKYLIDKINSTKNIEVWPNSQVSKVFGEKKLEGITITDSANKKTAIPTNLLFVFIGAKPHTDWLAETVDRDEHGFILTGPDLNSQGRTRPKGWILERPPYLLETNIAGVFAAGDVRHGSMKRIASAVGEGGMAIQFIQQYLSEAS